MNGDFDSALAALNNLFQEEGAGFYRNLVVAGVNTYRTALQGFDFSGCQADWLRRFNLICRLLDDMLGIIN